MTATASGLVSYRQMVKNLFKTMGSQEATVMHAAIGLSGEVAELTAARDRDEVVEEVGDIEFYLEALRQHVGGTRGQFVSQDTDIGSLQLDLVRLSGTVLDMAKKSWVYGRKLDDKVIHETIDRIDSVLAELRNILGCRKSEILEANQIKLGKRYPQGVYTDGHANERLDKQ